MFLIVSLNAIILMIQVVSVIQQQRCNFLISRLQSTSVLLRKKLQNVKMVSSMFKIAVLAMLFANVMNHSIRVMVNAFQHVLAQTNKPVLVSVILLF